MARPGETCHKACSRLDEDTLGLLPDQSSSKFNRYSVQRPANSNDHSKMHPVRADSLQYQCSVAELHRLNSCDVMQQEYGCTTCEVEFESFGPAFEKFAPSFVKLKDDFDADENSGDDDDDDLYKRQLEGLQNDGVCLVASHSMLLNCDNTDEDFARVCPCIPLPLTESALALRQSEQLESDHLHSLYALLPNKQNR